MCKVGTVEFGHGGITPLGFTLNGLYVLFLSLYSVAVSPKFWARQMWESWATDCTTLITMPVN